MYGENLRPNIPEPPDLPAPGTLMVDTSRADRVGEFRGVAGPYWSLRPSSAAARSGRPSPATYAQRS